MTLDDMCANWEKNMKGYLSGMCHVKAQFVADLIRERRELKAEVEQLKKADGGNRSESDDLPPCCRATSRKLGVSCQFARCSCGAQWNFTLIGAVWSMANEANHRN